MTPDPYGAPDAGQPTEALADDAAATAQVAGGDGLADLDSAVTAVADGADAAKRDAAEAARATTDAIGAARERLNAMADSLPPPARDAFRPFRTGGEAVGHGVEASYGAAMEGMAEFNSKAIAAWRSNAESTIRHWQSLAGVKSLSEAIALSAEHTRRQIEAVTVQTRELSALATRIVRSAADPLKPSGR